MKEERTYTEIDQTSLYDVLQSGKNILIYGNRGSGKTAIVEEYARDFGLKIAYLDLCAKLPEEIGGIPYALYTKETDSEGNVYYTRMLDVEFKDLIESKGEGWLIFADEINQGSPEVFNTLYSIAHPDPSMRRWGIHDISKCQVVGAGNLSDGTDGVVYVNDLPTPLEDRFFVFKLVPKAKDTMKYLSEKYKNLPGVKEYISKLIEEEISPRNIENVLELLQYNKSYNNLLIQSKLGSALTREILDIRKGLEPLDPAKKLKTAKTAWKQFQEAGELLVNSKVVYTEEELIDVFKSKPLELTEEEIEAVKKSYKKE